MAAKETKVRILSIMVLDGEKYQPNQIVTGMSEATVKDLEERGMVSTKEADIKYCTTDLGVKPVEHGKPKPTKQAADE